MFMSYSGVISALSYSKRPDVSTVHGSTVGSDMAIMDDLFLSSAYFFCTGFSVFT